MVNLEDFQRRGEMALRSTAPIYRLDSRDRLDFFGSGVFVRHDDRHFVVSAAHVLAQLRDRDIRIGGGSMIVPLRGRFFHTGPIGEVSFSNDSFDVAFVPVAVEEVAALGHPTFISTTDIDRGPTAGARYCAVGFIAKDFGMVGRAQSVEARATTLVAMPAAPEKYTQRGVGEDTHLMLSFDRLKTHGADGLAATPKIMGMSGCGIWRLDQAGVRLVAILTEHHQQRGKFIVSTRVATILNGLSAHVAGDLR